MIEFLALIFYAANVLAQFVDAVTTAALKRAGGVELNPVAAWWTDRLGLIKFLVGKGALVVIIGAILAAGATGVGLVIVFTAFAVLLAWSLFWLLRYNVPAYMDLIADGRI